MFLTHKMYWTVVNQHYWIPKHWYSNAAILFLTYRYCLNTSGNFPRMHFDKRWLKTVDFQHNNSESNSFFFRFIMLSLIKSHHKTDWCGRNKQNGFKTGNVLKNLTFQHFCFVFYVRRKDGSILETEAERKRAKKLLKENVPSNNPLMDFKVQQLLVCI